jgi:hypothetical protein
MNLWLYAFVALLCALAGVALGWWFSRLRSPYWGIGYVIPVVVIFAYAIAFYVPDILFLPPFSWMLTGIKKFGTFGFLATLLLMTPLSRVSQPRIRVMIVVLMAVIVFFLSIWPFLAPISDRKELSRLQTKVDENGICLQTTAYTCGPAAAVTALRKLGLPAEEGQVAILSCTSDQGGTPVDMLAEGLRNRYGKEGLAVKRRVFKSISELRQVGLTLAVVKYSLWEDHWVTVLKITDSEVIVGDPLAGLTHLSHNDFCKRWRFIGIVVQRQIPLSNSVL